MNVGPRGLESGGETRDKAGHQGDADGVPEHVGLHADVLPQREIFLNLGRHVIAEPADADLSEKQAKGRSYDSEQEALGEKLTNDAQAAGAHGLADRNLLVAAGG